MDLPLSRRLTLSLCALGLASFMLGCIMFAAWSSLSPDDSDSSVPTTFVGTHGNDFHKGSLPFEFTIIVLFLFIAVATYRASYAPLHPAHVQMERPTRTIRGPPYAEQVPTLIRSFFPS